MSAASSETPVPDASAISNAASANPPSDRSVAPPIRVRFSRMKVRCVARPPDQPAGGAHRDGPKPRPAGPSSRCGREFHPPATPPDRLCRASNRRFSSSDQTDRANCRGWQDARSVRFIIKADVARDDRHVQRQTGCADTFDRATSWPMIAGFSGFPKFRLSVDDKGFAPTAERFR